MNNIFNFLKIKKHKDTTDTKTYNMNEHTSFSNLIAWLDYEKKSIYGFKYGIKEGDYILSSMQSGKIAKFKVIGIEYMHTPKDQFFADVEFVNYDLN